MYHSFLIHSFTDEHLGCFQHLAIVNCAAMNIGVHRFFCIGVSGLLGYNPSSVFIYKNPAGVSIPTGCMWPRMAMNAAEHKIVNLLKIFFFFAHQFLLVFMYWMCGPRQLFFQCGPETPKGWTPLEEFHLSWCTVHLHYHLTAPNSSIPNAVFYPARGCVSCFWDWVTYFSNHKDLKNNWILLPWCDKPCGVTAEEIHASWG